MRRGSRRFIGRGDNKVHESGEIWHELELSTLHSLELKGISSCITSCPQAMQDYESIGRRIEVTHNAIKSTIPVKLPRRLKIHTLAPISPC